MQREITTANEWIKKRLGVTAVSFAYPCGNSWVGRGVDARSFIPLIATQFLVGRLFHDETANNPRTVDITQARSYDLDGLTFDQAVVLLEDARRSGKWLIFAGHEMDKAGNQTTLTSTLEKLLPYLKDPKNGYWVAPVGTVGQYIRAARTAATK
jgi:hypothetical protein